MRSSLDVMCVQFIKSSANDVHDSTHICNICKKKKKYNNNNRNNDNNNNVQFIN